MFLGIGSAAVQANCIEATFENGDRACIALNKNRNQYTVSVSSSNLSSTSSLVCEMLLPNQDLKLLGACNGSFSYSSSRTEKVRLYVRYNNRYYDTIDAYYNFNDGSWDSYNSIGG